MLPSLLRIKATTTSELLAILMNPLIGNWKRKDSECIYIGGFLTEAYGFKGVMNWIILFFHNVSCGALVMLV